jgi:hypothetical protein
MLGVDLEEGGIEGSRGKLREVEEVEERGSTVTCC